MLDKGGGRSPVATVHNAMVPYQPVAPPAVEASYPALREKLPRFGSTSGTERYRTWRADVFSFLDNQNSNAVTPRRVWNMIPPAFSQCATIHKVITQHQKLVTGHEGPTEGEVTKQQLAALYSAIKREACRILPNDREKLLQCVAKLGEICTVYMEAGRWSKGDV